MMHVLVRPPRESCSNRVSFDSLYASLAIFSQRVARMLTGMARGAISLPGH